ncbi:hypothetical protein LINPERHAP2_LOCUS6782 [Linum perenne]
MKRRLEYLWAKSGSIQVSDLSNNFYLVRFADQDDYSSAAFKGPWKVAVSRIGNSIGRTVRLDLATAEGSRGRYARVCVEIDVTKPLLGKFMIEDKVYKVEYESLENVCFDCGFYGHKREHCYSNEPHREKVDDKEAAPSTIPVTSTKDPDTGEWMTIQRRNRKKQAPPQVSASVVPAKTNNNNNTFSALQVEEPEVSQAAKNDQERTLELQTEKLRKVLEDALKESAQERPSASKGSKQKIRLALANITNLEVRGGDGKTDGKAASSAPEMFVPSMEDSRLVAVPVMYQNIAFQADSSEPKSAKAKPMLPRKTVTAKSKSPASSSNPSAYRRRVVKKKATISGQLVRTEPISKDIENDVHKTRKPPDRS